jgi:PAS domain S-box-containing protein
MRIYLALVVPLPTFLSRGIAKVPYSVTTWVLASALWFLVDLVAPTYFHWYVLHAAGLAIALRFVPRRRAILLATVCFFSAAIPGIIHSAIAPPPPTTAGNDWNPEVDYARLWTLVAIAAIAANDWGHRRHRAQRLISRRALHRRERMRTQQLRNAYDLLKREAAQRVSMQQRLADSESHLQSLMRHAGMHLLRKDREGRFTYASPTFCKLVNRTSEQVIGKSDFDLYPLELAQQYRDDDLEVMRTGEPFQAVEMNPQPDGSKHYVQVLKVPEYDDTGEVLGTQAVFWDVTDRWQSFFDLRRSETRKQALFESASDGILLVDAQQRIVEANPAAARILRLSVDQLIKRDISAVFGGPAGDQSWDLQPHGIRRETLLHRTAITPPATTADSKIDSPASASPAATAPATEMTNGGPNAANDEVFPAELSAHPIPVNDAIGSAIFIRDITTRHRASEDLRAAKEIAERASQAKSDFLAGVSHEIRTPLGGILGLSQLLADSSLTPRQRSHVEMICQSAELLNGVIEDILDFSSIEAGALTLHTQRFDLHECVGQAFKSLAVRGVGKSLEMIFDRDPDVPRWVRGDPIRFRQIVANLVGNAIKFTQRGEVRVMLRLDGSDNAKSESGVPIILEVIDTGIGIAPTRQKAIFEAFQQADTSTTRRFGGTGLGLAIAQRIASAMGGHIEVDSMPGHGSTFRCRVPMKPDTRGTLSPTGKSSLTAESQLSPPAGGHLSPSAGGHLSPSAGGHLSSSPAGEDSSRGSGEPQPQVPALRDCRIGMLVPNDHQYASLCRVIAEAGAKPYRIEPSAGQKELQKYQHDAFSADHLLVIDAAALPETATRSSAVENRRPAVWLNGVGQPFHPASPDWHPHLIKPVLPEELIAAIETAQRWRPGTMPGGVRSSQPARDLEVDSRLTSMRLMLVDDSPVNRIVIRDLLVSIGIVADIVEDGRLAVARAAEHPYDIILMDLQMPEMDGTTATTKILDRAQREGRDPPIIIALTAHVTSDHRQLCFRAGMSDFLTKPVRRAALVTMLEKHWLPKVHQRMAEAANEQPTTTTPTTTTLTTSPPANASPDKAATDQPSPAEPGADRTASPPQSPAPAGQADSSIPGDRRDETPSSRDVQPAPWVRHFTETTGQPADLFPTVADAFLMEVPQMMRTLRQAIRDQDGNAMRRAAHTLKSCLRYVSDGPEVALAQQIESAGKAGEVTGWEAEIDQLERAAENWCRKLRQQG